MKLYFTRFWAIGGWFTWAIVAVAGASLIGGVASSAISANDTKDAIENQQDILNSLQYQPIDINSLISEGQTVAANNAANSLKLEASLEPQLAATRATLPGQIQQQLQSKGNLPADVRNAVTTGLMDQIGASGGLSSGAAVPATAATLGTTALNLQQLYQGQAQNELNANPLPQSGLDPGSVASAMIANNTNQNQFNIEKAGGNASLAAATGQANAAEASGIGTAITGAAGQYAGLSSLQNLTNALNGLNTSAGLSPAGAAAVNNGFAATSPALAIST